jgi:lipopolysaccharide transport system permease protein
VNESSPLPSPAQDVASEWIGARPPRPREVLARLIGFPALLARHRDLVSTSVRRGLEARFQGTLFGWLWPLVQPLFLFAVYYFIFTKLLQQRIPDLPPGEESALGVYMFVGLLCWSGLAESVLRGTNVIVENGNLIKKLAFPSELLPLNTTLVSLVTQLFGLAAFVLLCLLTPIWPAPGRGLAWVPILLVLQGLFAFGLALFLATLQVFLRDTAQIVSMLLTLWMFATPIFWVPELIPTETLAPYRALLDGNPAYHLVAAWRGVLMGELAIPGRAEPTLAVSYDALPHALLVFALWALAVYAAGYAFFVLCQRRFADEV